MIPYDELVIALQTWRAKQGLSVAQLSGALTPPPAVAAPAAAPTRSGPPAAPPKAAVVSSEDFDEAALIEEAQYEPEGQDFAMPFDAAADGEQTAIGGAPRPSDHTLEEDAGAPPRSKGSNDDW